MSNEPQHNGPLDHIRTVNLHLRLVVDQISEGAMILEAAPLESPGPRVVFLNRGLCRLVGCRGEDLLGQPLSMFFEAERLGDFLSMLPRVAEAGKAFLTRAYLNGQGGERRYCRWTVSCVRDPEGRALNFLITVAEEAAVAAPSNDPAAASSVWRAQEAAEDDRMCNQARLESLEVIASGIAHDFRNHLTALMLNISNARGQAAGSEAQRQFLDTATAGAKQAQELADQLMEFARGGTPVTKVADAGHLLAESVRLALSGSRCVCHVALAPDLWPAKVDTTQIKQVINNLLINASQAMPKGGTILASAENVSLTAESGVDANPGTYVVVRVHDRGEGIPPDVLPDIFKRNFTTKKTGNGLGLASSYHIVRNHQGSITVTSKVGVGTEFSVYLPACPAEAVTVLPPKIEGLVIKPGSGSILVVDDQHVVRAAVVASVKALGYEAAEATTGEAAVEIYRKKLTDGRPFHVVLMDLTLPGGNNGDDAMREIRRLDPVARVIACSGAFDEDALESCRQLGYIGVLPKPFDVERLAAALDQAVRTSVLV